MFEDKVLVLKCKRGSKDAMCRIYQKYKDYLFILAKTLLHDKTEAEDIVHDVFVSFVKSVDKFELTGSLRGYLATCAGNLARDKMRARLVRANTPGSAESGVLAANSPEQQVMETEELGRLQMAISQLPYEQREAIVMHLKGRMKFREISKFQKVSISTVHGRYRYGMDKLRSLLNSEVPK